MNDENETLEAPALKAERLVKLLSDQRRALVTAGCDETILVQYAALIRFLKSATANEIGRIFVEPAITRKTEAEETEWSDEQVSNMPGAKVQSVIDDDSTLRKLLERIAILRFHVPRGSMRSFSNRQMLVAKLLTLLQNEQTHATIETVARGQVEPHGTRPKD
jgi:hypothetical protein